MTTNIVKIHPKAANAFMIEVYDRHGELSYILDCHTDGHELHILSRDADGIATSLLGVSGYSHEEQQRIKFANLTIKPTKKET